MRVFIELDTSTSFPDAMFYQAVSPCRLMIDNGMFDETTLNQIHRHFD